MLDFKDRQCRLMSGISLTGTFILNSSLLNLKRMSESVRWRSVVGLRTRTSWRFPGKEP